MHPIDRFKALVRNCDHEGIEGARDHVRPEHVEALCRFYFELDDYKHRCALVDLLADQNDPAMDAVCRDVLLAPGDDDSVELPKAFALSWLEGEPELYMRYYNDRRALAAAVQTALGRFVPAAAPEPTAAPAPALPTEANQACWVAATTGQRDALARLLQSGASAQQKRGDEPLLLATLMAGHAACALLLVEHGADPNAARAPGKQAALWWAAGLGYLDVVTALVTRGAAIDAADQWGGTPLQQACSKGHIEVARFLLSKGANPHSRYHDGRSVLNLAVRGLNAELLGLLLDAGADLQGKQSTFTPLAFACFEGTAEQVELLLRRGARTDVSIDYMGFGGTTPLMFAAQAGNANMVRALLGAGADKDARDGKGRTASDYAKGKNAERIRALLF